MKFRTLSTEPVYHTGLNPTEHTGAWCFIRSLFHYEESVRLLVVEYHDSYSKYRFAYNHPKLENNALEEQKCSLT